MGEHELESAVHELNKKNRTVCDDCSRRGQCYKEGRLSVYTTLSDFAKEEAYDYKGSHAIRSIGEMCPRAGERMKQHGKSICM